MAFYTFYQNNSGGFFTGPAQYVIIEAPNPKVADAMAEINGLYFDGVLDELDCDCCGDRWHRASDYDASAFPLIYDTAAAEYAAANPHRSVLVVYANGATASYNEAVDE